MVPGKIVNHKFLHLVLEKPLSKECRKLNRQDLHELRFFGLTFIVLRYTEQSLHNFNIQLNVIYISYQGKDI